VIKVTNNITPKCGDKYMTIILLKNIEILDDNPLYFAGVGR